MAVIRINDSRFISARDSYRFYIAFWVYYRWRFRYQPYCKCSYRARSAMATCAWRVSETLLKLMRYRSVGVCCFFSPFMSTSSREYLNKHLTERDCFDPRIICSLFISLTFIAGILPIATLVKNYLFFSPLSRYNVCNLRRHVPIVYDLRAPCSTNEIFDCRKIEHIVSRCRLLRIIGKK